MKSDDRPLPSMPDLSVLDAAALDRDDQQLRKGQPFKLEDSPVERPDAVNPNLHMGSGTRPPLPLTIEPTRMGAPEPDAPAAIVDSAPIEAGAVSDPADPASAPQPRSIDTVEPDEVAAQFEEAIAGRPSGGPRAADAGPGPIQEGTAWNVGPAQGGTTEPEPVATGIAERPRDPIGPADLVLDGDVVAEGAVIGAVIGTARVDTPAAGLGLTFALTDDAGGRFRIDASTGEISVAPGAVLDFETSAAHGIGVVVTDAFGQQISRSFTIHLTDVNETPTDIVMAGGTVAENAAVGTVVATLSTVDPDAGESFTYALSGAGAAGLAVVGNEIRVAGGLDFEAGATRTFDVTVTDTGGNTRTETVTVNLTDVNETPTDIVMAGGTVAENATVGTVDGSGGNDLIRGGSGADSLMGGDGNDTIEGGAGADTLVGGAGTDTLSYANSAAAVTVNFGVGSYFGGDAAGDVVSGFENLIGSALADTLTGNSAANSIDGGSGNDTIMASAGGDTVVGGDGIDTLFMSHAAAALTVNLALTTAQSTGASFGTMTINTIENLTGGGGNDSLTGSSAANVIDGGAGNDTIQGGAGADNLLGGSGNDTLTYASSTAAVNVNLGTGLASGGDAQGDFISGFETIVGSNFADTLTGNGSANSINGGSGNDTIVGSAGADTQVGGAGTDTLSYASSDAGVTVNLAAGTASGGHAQGDVNSGFEGLFGSAHADQLTGDAGINVIEGGLGADTLDGGLGQDNLSYAGSATGIMVNLSTGSGSAGDAAGDVVSGFEAVTGSIHADTIIGGAGGDFLTGGRGADHLTGGDGSDMFSYTLGDGNDTIEGGVGGGWVDAISLLGPGVTISTGWTLLLDSGHAVESQSSSVIVLTDDASGTILLSDGGTIAFQGIERIFSGGAG